MKKYNYVYKLKNLNPIDERAYYIGCRSCDCDPIDDIYHSSSKDIKNLIRLGCIFEKKIFKIFKTREEAILYEIYLHNRFDVSNNPKFYNKVKQSSKGFDTTGIIFIDKKPVKVDDYKKTSKKYHSYGKITVKDINGNIHWVDNDDERYLNGELINLTKGKMPIYINGKYEMIETKEYHRNKEKYQATNKSKISVSDENGNRFLVNSNDERYLNGELKSVHKGKILSRDENGNIHYVSKYEFDKLGLVGINKGKINGSNNPNAKVIKIYNKDNLLMFSCNGDFKETCKLHNLPFISLYKSYKNNGAKIYNSKRGKTEAVKKNNQEFIGWYAISE
jgi:hypothetical protein